MTASRVERRYEDYRAVAWRSKLTEMGYEWSPARTRDAGRDAVTVTDVKADRDDKAFRRDCA
jgi:hypothetical protein